MPRLHWDKPALVDRAEVNCQEYQEYEEWRTTLYFRQREAAEQEAAKLAALISSCEDGPFPGKKMVR